MWPVHSSPGAGPGHLACTRVAARSHRRGLRSVEPPEPEAGLAVSTNVSVYLLWHSLGYSSYKFLNQGKMK